MSRRKRTDDITFPAGYQPGTPSSADILRSIRSLNKTAKRISSCLEKRDADPAAGMFNAYHELVMVQLASLGFMIALQDYKNTLQYRRPPTETSTTSHTQPANE